MSSEDEELGNPRLPESPGAYVFKYFSMPFQVQISKTICPFKQATLTSGQRMQELKAVSDVFEIKICGSEANGALTIGFGFDIKNRTGSDFASLSWNSTMDDSNFNSSIQYNGSWEDLMLNRKQGFVGDQNNDSIFRDIRGNWTYVAGNPYFNFTEQKNSTGFTLNENSTENDGLIEALN